MGFLDVPVEIITLIMECIELDDVFNLSLTCRQFGQLIRSQSLSRVALKKAQYSLEFAEAEATGDYARGLRRMVKRRCAVRTARPFHVATLAVANDFIYSNGALCYTIRHEGHEYLRILLLRGCVSAEMEVNTRYLLLAALPGCTRHYKFRPLHWAHNIMSCVYTVSRHGETSSWLVIWNTRTKKFLNAHQLASTKGLFVRNDNNYVYYGSRSGHGRDGTSRWLIRGYDVRERSWSEKLVLHDVIGTSMGRTVCFEIFDGHLYGLSTQALAIADEENKSNSFYHAFRFRLGQHASMQVLPKSATWRRQATEGAIDDRWTQLGLAKDEASGQTYVYESRKEWLPSDSQSQRTCYKKELSFPHNEDGSYCDPEPDPENWDSELYSEARQADHVHSGDNGSKGATFTYHNTPIRTYNPSCQSFIDLVKDSDPAGSGSQSNTSRLRLRIRPNEPTSTVYATEKTKVLDVLNESCISFAGATPDETTLMMDKGVHYWPPRDSPHQQGARGQLLERIMNPQPEGAAIDWAADERLLIYSPHRTNKGQPRGLVLISFDPGLHLSGLPKLHGEHGGHAGDHHHCAVSPTATHGKAEQEKCNDATADVCLPHGEGGELQMCPVPQEETNNNPAVRLESGLETWVQMSRAYYLAIQGRDGVPYGLDMTR